MQPTRFPVRIATACLLAGLLAGPALAAQPAVQAEDPAASPAIISSVTADTLLVLLQAHGATLLGREQMANGSPVLLMRSRSDTTFAAFIDGSGAILQLRASWGGLDMTPAAMNAWNAQYRFTRAWIDEDADPVLAMDIDITGGVTPARLDDALQTFLRLSLPGFERFLGDRDL